MANLKVNYLFKDELAYELLLRGESVNSDVGANELRKMLRRSLRENKVPSVANLDRKVVMSEELKNLTCKLELLQTTVNDLDENSSSMSYARLETKLRHASLRLENSKHFKIDEALKNKFEKLQEQLSKIDELYKTKQTSVNLEELNELEQSLSDTMQDEESETPIVNTNSTPVLPNPENQNVPFQPTLRSYENSSSSNLFAKLKNPVEKQLEHFEITDGLNSQCLLKFLKNLIQFKKESFLRDSEVLNLIMPYAVGPLSNKILECKQLNCTVSYVHQQVINYFIPLALREKLKNDLVLRPQHPNEPLPVYIDEIKTNSEILCCTYSEQELVNFVKAGINPLCRNSVVFSGNPVTFKDLDSLCITSQNVAYNDFVRNKSSNVNVAPQNRPKPNYRPTNFVNHKLCYICGKPGHLARRCFYNENNVKSVPKNL